MANNKNNKIAQNQNQKNNAEFAEEFGQNQNNSAKGQATNQQQNYRNNQNQK